MKFRLFSLCLILLPLFAQAEEVQVLVRGSHEIKVLEIGPEETVVLTVYLGSAGDTLRGVPVVLKRQGRTRPLAIVTSDDHGIITFKGLPAGTYQLSIGLPRKERVKTTVKIGDVRLTRTKESDEGASNEKATGSG